MLQSNSAFNYIVVPSDLKKMKSTLYDKFCRFSALHIYVLNTVESLVMLMKVLCWVQVFINGAYINEIEIVI